jgi:ElaB/YqjD/DUF883 family membrane-anchored ribosome-binding protein
MGQSTEEVTQDIEATRRELSRDVDELTDKVSPGRVVQRRKEAAKNRLSSIRDRVMGGASDAKHSASSAGGSVTDSVTGTASGAVDMIQDRTEGNPLAAGLIAFGAGMLIASLIPATEKETDAAKHAVDTAKEYGEPLMDEAKSIGQDMGQNLKESATQAASEVKSTAQDSVQYVKEEAQSSAQNVKDQASDQN